VIPPSLAFVSSFSLIFILLGLSATGISQALRTNLTTLNKIAGIVIIAMGVFFVASLFITRLNAEWRVDALMERAGKGGPLVAGAAFAIAWTPCIGPTLTAILGLASTTDSVWKGGVTLAVYSLGLAIPFLLCALAMASMTRFFKMFRDHFRVITLVSGVILIVMGVMLYTNDLTRLNTWANDLGLNLISGA